ncbi:MAG: DUF3048 domain-containing protein [Clostridiales bacterium]|jgi:hypothetical protein|nr:DUF3048 domain-containing protein [Clostridiales bacterium]
MKIVLICALCLLLLTGCATGKATFLDIYLQNVKTDTGEDTNQTEAHEPTPEPTRAPSPTPVPCEIIDFLSGREITKEANARRPVAIVINNLYRALPQSGIGQADIVYEVLAEADITRLVGVYHDFDADKIGPVRSARHYFLDFALDWDAVFVHHGGSPQAYTALRDLGVDSLDGMIEEGITFWRDAERAAKPSMYEHSSYTGVEKLLEALESKRFRLETELEPPFRFFPVPTAYSAAGAADRLTVPFSLAYTTIFEYDGEARVYKRFNNQGEHIDEATGEQLAFANVIVQFVDEYIISGDTEGRREFNLVSAGTGYLFTGGRYMDIIWEKKSHQEPTRWFDGEWNKLAINRGKTAICVLNYRKEVIIE